MIYGYITKYIWIWKNIRNVDRSSRKQKLIVNGQSSEWKTETSGIPEWLILSPILFVILYIEISDPPNSLENNSKLYTCIRMTLKCLIEIKSKTDCDLLQQDISCMNEWSEK